MTDERLRTAIIMQTVRIECAVRANARGEIDYGAMAEVRREAIDALCRIAGGYQVAVAESG